MSTLEPKATIEDTARDSEKFNTVKNIVLNGVSDRQVHHFVHVEKVKVIKNSFLEYKVCAASPSSEIYMTTSAHYSMTSSKLICECPGRAMLRVTSSCSSDSILKM